MLNEIGLIIKQNRNSCGYSLRDLAKKTDLSTSYLSQIENGKVSPSLSSLVKIANSLGTTIQGLFEEVTQANENPVIRLKDRSVTEIERGVTISFLTNSLISKVLEVVVAELQVDAETGNNATAYKRIGSELLFVTKGKVEVTLGHETYVLHKGDSINMVSGAPHAVRNIYDKISEVIFVVVPH